MSLSFINCSYCNKEFLKDNRHINENKKLGNNSYCSLQCQYAFRMKQRELNCENLGCINRFKRAPSEISLRNFCSQSCAAVFNNSNRPKSLKAINNTLRRKKWQALTKEQKIKRKRVGSRLGGKNRWLNYKSEYNEDSIITAIQKFVNQYKRLPVKREMNRFYRPARFYFGTWNKAIEAAGFKPNPIMFADNCIANDGHTCNSIAEKIIDDYLSDKSIPHERNISYPEGKYTFDFKIGNRLVEYFGLAGEHKRYDQLRRIKQRIVKRYKLQFTEIYPKDLYPNSKLGQIFNTVTSLF